MSIDISYNNNLNSLNGFQSLYSLIYGVFLSNNTSLNDINGFQVLDHCGSFYIHDNDELEDISGFNNLTHVGDGPSAIFNNNNLQRISGFQELVELDGVLDINNNPALESISGFSKLNNIGNGLFIHDNPQLATCCGIFPFLDGGDSTDLEITIENNARGCNSEDEILNNQNCRLNDDTIAVPTISQWGFILLTQLLLIFSFVFLLEKKRALALK